MRNLLRRIVNIIFQPEQEWALIAREQSGGYVQLSAYLFPMVLISPLAYAGRVLLGGMSSAPDLPTADAGLQFVLLSVTGGFVASLLSVLAMALALRLVVPLFQGRRDFADAIKVVAYAGTPVWLAGIVMIMPIDRFPLLVIILVIAMMHGLFLIYLGLHYVAEVRRSDAAECTAIIVVVGVMLSSVAGYYASAAGLFSHL